MARGKPALEERFALDLTKVDDWVDLYKKAIGHEDEHLIKLVMNWEGYGIDASNPNPSAHPNASPNP